MLNATSFFNPTQRPARPAMDRASQSAATWRRSERPLGVRFGNDDSGDRLETMKADALKGLEPAYNIFKLLEQLGRNGVQAGVQALVQGDRGLLQTLNEAIKLEFREIGKTRSLTRNFNENVGMQVVAQSGNYRKTFKHRTNLFTRDDYPDFQSFMEARLGSKKRVVVAATGWTAPPLEYFLKSERFRKEVAEAGIDRDDWPAYAEFVYVEALLDYLKKSIRALRNDPKLDFKTSDLTFVYGVTPKGVDLAIENFCAEEGIKCLGVTAYNWIREVEDTNEPKPDIYIVEDVGEFRKVMSETPEILLITGGADSAIEISRGNPGPQSRQTVLAADVLQDWGVDIPDTVPSTTNPRESKVLNAAKVVGTRGNGQDGHNDYLSETIQAFQESLQRLHIAKNATDRFHRLQKVKNLKSNRGDTPSE